MHQTVTTIETTTKILIEAKSSSGVDDFSQKSNYRKCSTPSSATTSAKMS